MIVTHVMKIGSKWLLVPALLMTLVMAPVWLRIENAPAPFTFNYVMGFAIFFPIVWSILMWFVLGRPGLRSLNRQAVIWLGLLFLLVVWSALSLAWAFVRVREPGVAIGVTLQLLLTVLFITVLIATNPEREQVVYALVLAMIVYAVIGGLQVARQQSIGLEVFGEFKIGLRMNGVSVIESGSLQWLRPYGLASHPNIYAGFLVVGVLASGAWVLSGNVRLQWIGTFTFWFGLYGLFLTFSRGAWLGFVLGSIVLCLRVRQVIWQRKRQVMIALSGAIGLGVLFFVLYQPLLLARAGVGQEYVEQRSINDRVVFLEIAESAIRENPLLGVGAGNFPWYASSYLYHRTDSSLKGDNVHNIYLTVQAELGSVGTMLFLGVIGLGFWRTMIQEFDVFRSVLFAGFIGLAVIGLVESYPWTLIHYQILMFGLLALSST